MAWVSAFFATTYKFLSCFCKFVYPLYLDRPIILGLSFFFCNLQAVHTQATSKKWGYKDTQFLLILCVFAIIDISQYSLCCRDSYNMGRLYGKHFSPVHSDIRLPGYLAGSCIFLNSSSFSGNMKRKS